MSRRSPLLCVSLIAAVWLSGCKPQQPFYLYEDGDMSHYVGVATDIEYPDVNEPVLGDVEGAVAPFTLAHRDVKEVWDLRLEEAVQIALTNSKVMKSIGGTIIGPPDYLLRNPTMISTIYDPAIIDSDPRGGVEAALSAFDAQLNVAHTWDKISEPTNAVTTGPIGSFIAPTNLQDRGTFQWQISKLNATGGQTSLTHSWVYLESNSPTRQYPSDWTTRLKAEFRQPLLQGRGVEFNRINGPSTTPGNYSGVLLARINNDIALCDFEQSVRNLASDVENAYWEVYYAYRQLDAVIAGRDSGLQNWRDANLKLEVGSFAAHEEAQARNQYFIFRASVERSLTALYQAEAKLRYIMGLASTDGRLIRPIDEPTTAKVVFNWCDSHSEAISRSSELREFRWYVKRRELELIAAKNFLLPRLDLVGNYQWIGLGQELIESSGGTGDYTQRGSNSFQSLTSGDFADWTLGLQLNMPLGFRREMAGVRNAQLLLARERAKLQEAELEVSHQLAFAMRELDSTLVQTQTNYNRRIAARDEVKAAREKYRAGVRDGTLTNVLDAERRLAEAESDYYRTLVDYNKSIAQVHFRKGSLLEYNGVYLAEGPWPAKAHFDATRRARERDASLYLDYGFTLPGVISRGAINQRAGEGMESVPAGEPTLAEPPSEPETLPAGVPVPMKQEPTPAMPAPPRADMSGQPPAAAPMAKSWQTKGAARDIGRFDLGKLDLSPLAAKAPATTKPAPVEKPAAAVQPTNYQEPATPAAATSSLKVGEGTTSTSRIRWSEPKGVVTARPAEDKAATEGWKSPAR